LERSNGTFHSILPILKLKFSGLINRIAITVLSLIGVPKVFAQQPDTSVPNFLGLGVTGGLNEHSLNRPVYDGATLCGLFQEGSSVEPNFFLLYERPLVLGSPWSLSPRVHLNNLNALLTTPSVDNARIRDPKDSSLVPFNREHRLSAYLQTFGLDLYGRYAVTPWLNAFGGPSVGMLISKEIKQTEAILSPTGTTFTETNADTRTLYNGVLENANSLQAYITLGVSSDLQLARKLYLTPEVSYSYPLTAVQSDEEWKISALRFGAVLKVNLNPTPLPEPPPVVEKKMEPEPSQITASVDVVGVDIVNGSERETAIPVIRVEELATREAYPILNYVFFDDGNSIIPSRYHTVSREETANFDTTSLIGKPVLSIYYDILNLVGKRMQERPQSMITLTGTNSMKGQDAGNAQISKKRAESVKDYLTTVWKIDPKRIKTEAVDLPRFASSTDTKEGEEENRRVEITTNDASLFDPLVLEKIDREMNPPILRTKTNISSRYPIQQSAVTLSQSGKTLASFTPAKSEQDWRPQMSELPSTDAPLIASLDLTDEKGTHKTVSDTTQVDQLTIKKKREERIQDKIVERYNLITFEYDKADLDERSKRIVSTIANNVTAKDSIEIVGYTDLSGDAAHNQKLSQDRAKNVEAALGRSIGTKANTVQFASLGAGEQNLVDNSRPEGRFLSRTVLVKINRPIAGEQ